MMSYDCPHPVSRTYQYKKVTKPLLERKRRARINRCLDELKDLMVDALETEGEDVSKLEKADILELTVRHLQRLQATRSPGSSGKTDDASAESRWLSGFGHCATEACRFLSALPGEAAERLARHLATGLQTNRQSNPINLRAKSNSLSPALANLDLTANLIAPGPTSPSNEISKSTSPKIPIQRPAPYPDVSFGKSCSRNAEAIPCNSQQDNPTSSSRKEDRLRSIRPRKSRDAVDKITGTSRKTSDSHGTFEDDEEIDVEHVDEKDPMWRPW